MKKLMLAEFISRLQSSPKLKKKLKIFIGIAFVGLLLVDAVAAYIGIKSVHCIAGLAPRLEVGHHAEAPKSNVEGIPAIVPSNCLTTAERLLNIEKLLSTPIKDSFQNLKQACFEAGPLTTE